MCARHLPRVWHIRGVFDHVTIRASDREASQAFYETVLSTLGIEQTYSSRRLAEWDDFTFMVVEDDKPATHGLHIGFYAASRELVDEFWSVGTAAGYADDGAPGPRPQYGDDYYGGFLLDPDGNSAEAVHHGRPRGGTIDHMWVRVADVEASKRFYATMAPLTGFKLKTDEPQRAQFTGSDASFSVVAGTPTENLHIAFRATDDATVDAFHRTATEAGYPDDGPPGERPIYHAGYYGAYVLDPDGNSVEVVNHNRPALASRPP
jgi:catechol 2,3-dioxygenase-like lactoylglutathione lyase family enzyme